MGMRRIDWADRQAERLYDMVRDAVDDQKVIDAIAQAIRDAYFHSPSIVEGVPRARLGRD